MLYHWNILQFKQQATSQRIDVDATAFRILWELFMIINKKSSKFELDWEIWLPKTNQIWTVYVYEAVKNDLANSKETSFNNIISNTLSFITVLFKDLVEAVNRQAEKCGEKEDPKPSITSLNKTNTCDGYDFNIDIINDDEYSALQKES